MPEATPEFNIKDLQPIIDQMGRLGQSAIVVLAVSRLDDALENLIIRHMPNLTAKLRKDLFGGRYGPLQNFSTKIDLAYVLGDIDKQTKTDLHTIRRIRNLFAHPDPKYKVSAHFGREGINKLFSEFSDYKPGMDPYAHFVAKSNECLFLLFGKLSPLGQLTDPT